MSTVAKYLMHAKNYERPPATLKKPIQGSCHPQVVLSADTTTTSYEKQAQN